MPNKGDKRYLLNLKINLESLKKPSDITKVAFLVDREDFLNDVYAFREDLGLTELVPRENLLQWHYLDALVRKNLEVSHEEKIRRNRKVKDMVESLMTKYKKNTPEYWQIIFSALLTGKVEKSDITYTVYPYFTSKEITIKGPQTLLAIYPNTTQKDLIEAFNSDEVKYLLKQQEQQAMQYIDKKFGAIRDTRKWYWWNIKGMSYSDISEKETGDRMAIEKKVGTYIRRYKNELA